MSKNYRNRHNKKPVQDLYQPPYAAEVLSTDIGGLNLSVETLDVLRKGGVNTVGDIAKRRLTDMYKVQNFNKKKLFEVKNAIAPLGVDFRPAEASKQEGTVDAKQQNNPQRAPDAKRGKNDAQKAQVQGRNGGDNLRSDDNMRGAKQRQADGQQANFRKDGGQNKQSQDKGQKNKNRKENNAVDFSRIFPREPLVHSARIEPEKDRFVKFQRAGKWGFKDEHGREVIPPIYTEVLNFKEDMAAVEMNGLFGYINRENELVVPYKYDCAGSFSEGWANVSLGEKCGYIDKAGKDMVPFIYDAATAFTGEGYARVKKDGRWGNITKDGNVNYN